ncbi:hypothetical protein [Bacillus sp. FJAT-44742]|nr:hypothetical protein [Bacillus sp. FJAT-44742]
MLYIGERNKEFSKLGCVIIQAFLTIMKTAEQYSPDRCLSRQPAVVHIEI